MSTDNRERTVPRIGQIGFSNCLPINLPIERGLVDLEGEFISKVPGRLNEMILEEKLDISAVSLFCYLNSDELDLVPGLSVSSLGPVGSVLFFYKGALEDLDNKTVFVPNASATSINLLSIILAKDARAKANLQKVQAPDINSPSCQGALIIGDEALKVDSDWSAKYNRIDLGKWWYDRFQLPMVFGVWAVRRKYAARYNQTYKQVEAALNTSRDIGLDQMLDDVVEEASKHMKLDKVRVRKYFIEELDYNLNSEHKSSIELYREQLTALNLLALTRTR